MLPQSKECVCGAVIPNDWHYCWECKHKRDMVMLDEGLHGSERPFRHAKARIRASKHQPTKARMGFLHFVAKVLASRDEPVQVVHLKPEEREIDALVTQERILAANKRMKQTLANRVPQALKDWHDQD